LGCAAQNFERHGHERGIHHSRHQHGEAPSAPPPPCVLGACTSALPTVRMATNKLYHRFREALCNPPACDYYQDDWHMYRIGDMVSLGFLATRPVTDWAGSKWTASTWPTSLMAEFLNRTYLQDWDHPDITIKREAALRTLLEVINKRPPVAHEGGTTIHLRVGDVLDGGRATAFPIARQLCVRKIQGANSSTAKSNGFIYYGGHYAEPLPYWKTIATQLLNAGVHEVVMVVGGSREWENSGKLPTVRSKAYAESPRSCAYTQAVVTYLSQFVRIKAIQNSDPDTDFILAARSKIYVPSGTGMYDQLVGHMVLLQNNTVLRPTKVNGQTIGWEHIPECANASTAPPETVIGQIHCSV